MTPEHAGGRRATAVLIAGGGPVGLALALTLDHFGVDCVVAERNAGTTQEPRANGLRQRSMELFRHLGIEEELHDGVLATMRSRFPDIDAAGPRFGFSESLVGEEWGAPAPVPVSEYRFSPAAPFPGQQDILERKLFAVAERRPHIRLEYGTEVTSFTQGAGGLVVETRSRESGATTEWSASYLVGADGTGSLVRSQSGIAFEGPASLVVGLRETWTADLGRYPQLRRQGGIIVSPDPDVPGSSVVGTLPDGPRRSTFFGILTGEERHRPWSDADAVRAIRRQVGIPELDVELRGWSTFRMGNRVAASYRDRRVLLAGDAAHTFPASGGFGLNTGLADVFNLGWKLAFVLQGLAGEELLDSYEQEQRPVAQSNGAWSTTNLPRLGNPTPDCPIPPIVAAARSRNPDRLAFVFKDLEEWSHCTGRTFGHVYEQGAFVDDGTARPPFSSRHYVPTDRPGARFPHQWVDVRRSQSTLDWFGPSFTLVTGPMGDEWLEAGRLVSSKVGVPLALRTLPTADPGDGFELGLRGTVLVRPDGYVAWRRAWVDSDPVAALADALTAVLRRGGQAPPARPAG